MSGLAGPPSFASLRLGVPRVSSSSREVNGVDLGAEAIASRIAAALQSGHDMRSFLCSQKGEPVTTTPTGGRVRCLKGFAGGEPAAQSSRTISFTRCARSSRFSFRSFMNACTFAFAMPLHSPQSISPDLQRR